LHSKDHLLKKYGKLIRTAATNEKNAQIRVLRELFLCNEFKDFQLVENVLSADAPKGPMKLSPRMAAEFDTVADLQKAILSNHMYTHEALYDVFSAGLEHGKLRGMQPRTPCPVTSMLTIAHEAHFRLEIASCLERQGFRHPLGLTASQLRSKRFAGLCKLIHEDRANNGVNAWDTRRDQPSFRNADDGLDDNDANAILHGACEVDARYY
jgi:hypothetical protein